MVIELVIFVGTMYRRLWHRFTNNTVVALIQCTSKYQFRLCGAASFRAHKNNIWCTYSYVRAWGLLCK